MPFSQQSIVLSNPAGPMFQVQIGNETYLFDGAMVRAIANGVRSLDFLLSQFVVVLQQAGIDPNTATLLQIKQTLEAKQYWWGN